MFYGEGGSMMRRKFESCLMGKEFYNEKKL